MKTGIILMLSLLAVSAGAVHAAVDKAHYVDAERGSDANDGLSAERAWRSLQRVNAAKLAPGSTVRFRRGGEFHGQLVTKPGVIRFAEDQFVEWTRPFDTPVGKRMVIWGPLCAGWWTNSAPGHRLYPAVEEQYRCYVPVDASAAKLIRTYLALYRAEGRPLDLAKARALGDMMTRVQRADGSIPTWWNPDSPRKDDWLNCMIASARALEELLEFRSFPNI